eukprot:TRINITY_DN4994_c0_g1_i1.p1 TRINITY_DN4994_c0_g1~~TRINITY_DN4994_c0_g1_i1.p1  ORF type:complete len:108 (-),score=16.20 TRINITY_DN4994_c0_g1_i1:19-342(-)
MSAVDVEKRFDEIKDKNGVEGVILFNSLGQIIKSSYDNEETTFTIYHAITPLVEAGKQAAKEISPKDEMGMLTLHLGGKEIVIIAGGTFHMVVTLSLIHISEPTRPY